ncbi:MAG TPA: hypothetical protein VIR60_00350 [Gammaproteobacteria bacterium]
MLKPVPNPAWQPAQENTRRLFAISHHFLSEPPAVPAPAPETHRLAVLLATQPDTEDAALPDSGYLLRALARQLDLPGSGDKAGWSLQTYAQARDVPRGTPTLLLVDPTLAATRTAYALIKHLCQDGCGPVGVLYRAGDDLAAARRCYRRLAVGTLRFIGQSIVNLGWLPNRGPHFAAALAHAAQTIHSQQRGQAPLSDAPADQHEVVQ